MKNRQKAQLEGREILGKKVLILGEAGSGKTKVAARLLQEIMKLMNPEKITIIDLAPQRVSEIGGKISDYVNVPHEVKYLSPENVYTPRLAATSPKQLLHYAELNRKSMEPLFNRFIRNATDVLAVNDVTLYFHLGRLETVSKCVNLAKTFLATAYCGSKFAKDLGTGISFRERKLTEKLTTCMNLIVNID